MEFVCRLGTPSGEIITRTMDAMGEQELRVRLERDGFRVFALTVHEDRQKVKVFGRGEKLRVKIEDFLLFNQQLSALLRAGLPILQSIGVLKRRQPNAKLKEILDGVEERIKSGVALSEAFAQTGAFPRIYTASILAGERSGSLDEVLKRYVSYTKSLTELRRKLKKALTYPAILIFASGILITILTTYVIPKFAEFYNAANARLPTITLVVVGVSNAIVGNIAWIAPLLTGLVVGFFVWRASQRGRRTLDGVLLKVPVVGDLIKQTTTAQLTRSLATLLQGGITLIESFEIAAEAISNRRLRETAESVLASMREGRAFTDSLEQTGWVPELALDMIGVGEKSGALTEMLDQVAGFYDAELDVRISSLTSLIEPAILIFMGGVVTTILLAMYLPLLTAVSAFGR